MGTLWLPGMTLLSHGADDVGLDQAFGFALMNLAWALRRVHRAAAGGAVAKATADAVPYLTIAATAAIALAAVSRRAAARPVPSADPRTDDDQGRDRGQRGREAPRDVDARAIRSCATTTRMPSAVSVHASPSENATIRSSPQRHLMLGDRAEQHHER